MFNNYNKHWYIDNKLVLSYKCTNKHRMIGTTRKIQKWTVRGRKITGSRQFVPCVYNLSDLLNHLINWPSDWWNEWNSLACRWHVNSDSFGRIGSTKKKLFYLLFAKYARLYFNLESKWEIRCEIDVVRKTLWKRREKSVVSNSLLEKYLFRTAASSCRSG